MWTRRVLILFWTLLRRKRKENKKKKSFGNAELDPSVISVGFKKA